MIVAAPASSSGSSFLPLLVVAGLIGLMYFMVIRPQSRRRKQMHELQASVDVGSSVVTIGGLYGTVVAVDEESVMLEVAPGVTCRYARGAIGQVRSDTEPGAEDTGDAAGEEPGASADGKTWSDGAESR